MCLISATRERLPDEIKPVSAEQSRTRNDSEEVYGAANAIDLEHRTRSYAIPGSDGIAWLKVNLGRLNCIQQVITHFPSGSPKQTWTCRSSNCSTCKGMACSRFLLTTSVERTSSDGLPLIADCKYGDTVKLERSYNVFVYEIAIIGKQGEIRYWKLIYTVLL